MTESSEMTERHEHSGSGLVAEPVALNPSDIPQAAAPDDGRLDDNQFELQLLKQAIDRTDAIVRDETAALKRGGIVDLHEFSGRKSHQLLALKRAFDATVNVPGKERMAKDMDLLREALAENSALLQTRLAAVQEVADIISSVMRHAESDGTYSQMVLGGAK